MAFDDFNEGKLEKESSLINQIEDEDEFDEAREKFIISRLEEIESSFEHFDRIIYIAGNMHTSKQKYYFSLSSDFEEHIGTSSMCLSKSYSINSIFTLPFSGESSYQVDGKLEVSEIKVTSPHFIDIVKHPFDGIKKSDDLDANSIFKESYDWVFGIQNATASKVLNC